jgi:uncharacterized membrane protein
MEKMAVEFMSSLATVALAILAVVTFIYYGAGLAFYAVVVVAIFVGFINAWLISRATPGEEAQKAAVVARRTVRRGARPRKKASRRS